MPPTITIDKNTNMIHEAFGLSDQRIAELAASIESVQAGFQTIMDALQYMKAISRDNQELAFLLLTVQTTKE